MKLQGMIVSLSLSKAGYDHFSPRLYVAATAERGKLNLTPYREASIPSKTKKV
jgi:hypothetical protein